MVGVFQEKAVLVGENLKDKLGKLYLVNPLSSSCIFEVAVSN